MERKGSEAGAVLQCKKHWLQGWLEVERGKKSGQGLNGSDHVGSCELLEGPCVLL